jgi:hypothetical protein
MKITDIDKIEAAVAVKIRKQQTKKRVITVKELTRRTSVSRWQNAIQNAQ